MKKSIEGVIIFFGKKYKLISPLLRILPVENDRQKLIAEADKSIDAFEKLLKDIDSVWKNKLEEQVKKKVYRLWIKACIKRGLHKTRRARRDIARSRDITSDKKLAEHIDVAVLSVNFTQRLLDYNKKSSIFFKKGLHDHIIPLEKIEKGDIIISYKTNFYLKSHLLSKLIAYATLSKTTHAEFVSEKRENEIRILACRPETKGVKEITYNLRPGEMAFVFRPNIGRARKRKLLNRINELTYISREKPSEYKFSELKCWIACFLGLLYTRGVLLGSKNLIFQNPTHKMRGFFCSEIIEDAFYSIGIHLTPRSDCRSTVGPSEIFHSPHLRYKGVFCSPEVEIFSEKRLDF